MLISGSTIVIVPLNAGIVKKDPPFVTNETRFNRKSCGCISVAISYVIVSTEPLGT